mgnify:FL=1
MIEYTNTIDTFDELYNLCWSGALQRLDEIRDLDLEDEFMEYLSDILSYSKDLTLTDINDFIWFEVDEWIEEHKGEEND